MNEWADIMQSLRAPLLCAEEEQALARRIQTGDREARNRLIEHNLRLVLKTMQPYVRTQETFDDLIQEGMLGLLRAADRYDGRGRFSTYAIWWIRQAISRSVEEDRLLTIPVHVREHLRRLKRLLAEREWSVEELAERLSLSIEQIERMQQLLDRTLISLDVVSSENHHWEERLASSEDLEAHFMLSDDQERVREAIAQALSPREQEIIRRYFGIGYPEESGEMLARRYQVSRARIQQIKQAACAKLACYLSAQNQEEVK